MSVEPVAEMLQVLRGDAPSLKLADASTNSLIVSADPQVQEVIAALLRKLDERAE
jgi:type II secretory pathway component GspD/PulD (secretin)